MNVGNTLDIMRGGADKWAQTINKESATEEDRERQGEEREKRETRRE